MKWMILIALSLVVPALAYEWATELEIKYRSPEWCANETRMMLEADEIPDSVIVDSLRHLPKGGELDFLLPVGRVPILTSKSLVIRVRNAKGKVIVEQPLDSTKFAPAERNGWYLLLRLPLIVKVEKSLLIEIENASERQMVEYPMELMEP